MGITSILLVSGKGHVGHFLELLGSGSQFGVKLSYELQEEAGGIAQALSLAEDFADNEPIVVVLGDNVYEDNLASVVDDFINGDQQAHVFLKLVDSPEHYGVPEFEGEEISAIFEKPSSPPSQYAVTGCYLYRPNVFEVIRTLKPSSRGELEISDVNDYYVKQGTMGYTVLNAFWGDCGESIDGMMEVSNYIQKNFKSFLQQETL